MGLTLDERELSAREYRDAARVASRAFFDDPFFHFLSPDDALRARGLAIFFRTQLRHHGSNARIVTVRNGPSIVGVAAWLPTGCYPEPVRDQLAQIPGTIRALYRRPRALRDGTMYLRATANAHPKDAHWYLYLLVADPTAQRRGVGTTLMHHGLALVDDDGVASYLETQNEDNLAYYHRFGYELRDTLRPVVNGPALYTMWRAPR